MHGHVTNACLGSTSTIFGINWGVPEPFTTGLFVSGFGLSILAILSSLVQLVSSRQLLPPADPRTSDDTNVKTQRQMAYFLPFISILYGGVVPAGLMLYWIASSAIAVVQQFFVVGFGGIFPLFGWNPQFARDYTPALSRDPARAQAHRTRRCPERGGALEERRSGPVRPLDDPAQPNSRTKSGRRGRRR